jgi:hypothetical protein
MGASTSLVMSLATGGRLERWIWVHWLVVTPVLKTLGVELERSRSQLMVLGLLLELRQLEDRNGALRALRMGCGVLALAILVRG